jgi:Leucine-rich repeat (LRR) protein
MSIVIHGKTYTRETEEVFLRNCCSVIPKELEQITNLKRLYLYENSLYTLEKQCGVDSSDTISKLVNLQTLELGMNKLSTLPESIGNLVNLLSLSVAHNNIKILPDSIVKLVNLAQLDLRMNKLSTLPESIGNLVNLRQLSLNNNQLAVIPESIGKLVKLKELYFVNNQLAVIPESIGNLVDLEVLHLDRNKLTTLPESIGELVNLKTLNLQRNNLVLIPAGLVKIKKTITITNSSYQIDNLSQDGEILIFSDLGTELTNIPASIKEIHMGRGIKFLTKIPFGCKIITKKNKVKVLGLDLFNDQWSRKIEKLN